MNYNYSVVYSRRRSVSISVSALNEITVRCPVHYSKENIERFLKDKSDWLDRVLRQNNLKLSQNEEIINFKEIYVHGERLPLTLGSDHNAVTYDGVYVKNVKFLKLLYMRTFFDDFNKRVGKISLFLNLVPDKISVRDYKSRWGCCDGKNRITFNYKIFMLPENLQDYIIVHELCHIRHHNHSNDFWKLVEKFFPQYKSCRKGLKKYDFLTRLY